MPHNEQWTVSRLWWLELSTMILLTCREVNFRHLRRALDDVRTQYQFNSFHSEHYFQIESNDSGFFIYFFLSLPGHEEHPNITNALLTSILIVYHPNSIVSHDTKLDESKMSRISSAFNKIMISIYEQSYILQKGRGGSSSRSEQQNKNWWPFFRASRLHWRILFGKNDFFCWKIDFLIKKCLKNLLFQAIQGSNWTVYTEDNRSHIWQKIH